MMQRPVSAQSSIWWLPRLVAALGPADACDRPELERWTWQDGEIGVFIDRLTHAWQTVVWSPRRSVTLRGIDAPTDADMTAAIALAGLLESPGAGVTHAHGQHTLHTHRPGEAHQQPIDDERFPDDPPAPAGQSGEGAGGPRMWCRCMRVDCPNEHYADVYPDRGDA